MDQQKYIRTYLLGAEHKYFQRSALGQGHETYGEDPYLAGVLGTAFVKGMQGDGKYRKTDATLKHFAVHSGPEGIRHSFNSVVSERICVKLICGRLNIVLITQSLRQLWAHTTD